MKNKYSRPTLELSHWLVNCKDLERICNFFQERLPGKEIRDPSIEVEVKSGNNKEYCRFEDFLKEIQQLLSVNEEIEEINFHQSAGKTFPPNAWSKAVRIRIDFKQASTSFYTHGGDDDGSVRDWIAGTHEALQQLVDSLKHDESLTKLIQKKYAKDYSNSAIIFDYDGSILEQLTKEVKKSLH